MPPVAVAVTAAIAATPVIGVVGIGGAAAIGSAVVSLGTSVALSYGAQLLQRTQSDRGLSSSSLASINAPEVRGSVKQSTPIQRIVIGEVRVGGAMFLYEVDPPYLYTGIIHSDLPVSEYVTLYIGENSVALNGSGQPIEAPYLHNSTARLTVATQTGLTLGQGVNSLISADFSDYGSTFVHPGKPVTVAKFDYGADADEFELLWGNVQIPDLQWVLRGTPLPDPRNPSHILSFDPRDPEELYAAIASWDYSNTAALAQAFVALMDWGLNAGPDNIRWDDVARAADFDEERVPILPLSDGATQKRHTVDGVISLDQKPNDVLEAMLTANRGFIGRREGMVSLSSSQPRTAEFTITDAMMVGGFEYRHTRPKKDRVNVVRSRFVAPDRAYQEADGPVRRDSDLVTSDGEELEQTVTLPFTATHQRAQRLMKAFMSEARLGKTLTCECDLRALGVTEGMIVQVWHRTYPSLNGLYSVEEWSLGDDMSTVGFLLTEYDADIARDWDATNDEETFAILDDD